MLLDSYFKIHDGKCNTEYYSAEKNDILPFCNKMDGNCTEVVMVSEISEKKKHKT